MPRCKYCNELKPPGECFQDPNHKSNQYCSEEHWKLHIKSKNATQTVDTSKNKPKPKSDRVKLTDYIQSIWPVEPNWKWMSKQIENLSKETGLSYNDMRMTLKYCIEYKGFQPDENYGLQQFIPRYSKEADDFAEDIRRIQSGLGMIDFEDELVKVPVGKKRVRRPLKEDVDF